jgi:hypothetical protein
MELVEFNQLIKIRIKGIYMKDNSKMGREMDMGDKYGMNIGILKENGKMD